MTMRANNPRFNGSDCVPDRDDLRLSVQYRRIFALMADGVWRGLADIQEETGDPPASISAQLRHLRKPRFGAHTVQKVYLEHGLYHYRLVVNPLAVETNEEED
jgi:hypothetical protein